MRFYTNDATFEFRQTEISFFLKNKKTTAGVVMPAKCPLDLGNEKSLDQHRMPTKTTKIADRKQDESSVILLLETIKGFNELTCSSNLDLDTNIQTEQDSFISNCLI